LTRLAALNGFKVIATKERSCPSPHVLTTLFALASSEM